LERPFKGRTYGIMMFPQIFETFQQIQYIMLIELVSSSFISLDKNTSEKSHSLNPQALSDAFSKIFDNVPPEKTRDISPPKSVETKIRTSFTQPVEILPPLSQFAGLEPINIGPERPWQNSKFDQVKELMTKIQVGYSKEKPGIYPYLLEFALSKNDENTQELYKIVNEIMHDINETSKPQKMLANTPSKPALKQKQYEIIYDAKLHAKVQRESRKPLTNKDIKERKQHIKLMIKTGNEEIKKEITNIEHNTEPEKEKKVKLSDAPPVCVFLIPPEEVLKNGPFTRNSQSPLN